MHDSDGHPSITDATGSVWTWRGEGYAIEGLPDLDWLGRPWTTTRDTVIEKFGRAFVPLAART